MFSFFFSFFFFRSMHCLFSKKMIAFFLFFLMLCSIVFKFLFSSFLPFSIVLYLFSFFFLIVNCSFTIFLNLISASLCLYLNITTIGSCLPTYSISNNISIKQTWFINKTFFNNILSSFSKYLYKSIAHIQPSFLHFYLFRTRQHNTNFLLTFKDELKYPEVGGLS